MDLNVEFLGLARELAGTKSCSIRLENGASYRCLVSSLAQSFPAFVGPVIDGSSGELTSAFMLNIAGRAVVTNLDAPASDGQHVLLLFAEAGG